MTTVLTTSAFDAYRLGRQTRAIRPDVPRMNGDADQMSPADGLEKLQDGPVQGRGAPGSAPEIPAKPEGVRLWAVGPRDVVHAAEVCDFGLAREAKVVKHSNLTGGAPAYCGGELLVLGAETLVVNGCSGRYRVADAEEMKAVASAFRGSAYNVWSMGWNVDVDRPAMFGTQDPEWVAA